MIKADMFWSAGGHGSHTYLYKKVALDGVNALYFVNQHPQISINTGFKAYWGHRYRC